MSHLLPFITRFRTGLLNLVLLLGASLVVQAQTIRYVRTSGTNADPATATTWATSTTNLQGAIDASGAGDQVWVAQGTYKPGGNANTNREISFSMKNGVAIYGSFPATGTPASLSERNPGSFTTVLSGDIGAEGNTADNSYHVVSNPNRLISTAVLDGFIITGGNANGSDSQSFGGGMLNGVANPDGSPPSASEASSPTLRNCLFLNNSASSGGGIINLSGNPTLLNCLFQDNSASSSGGGLINFSGNPTLTNCSFQSNSAQFGGGMFNSSGNPTLTNCSFQSNSAQSSGGGVVSFSGNPTLTNCSFQSNSAQDGGGIANGSGGLTNGTSNMTLTNCSFQNNSASRIAGGIGGSDPIALTNCVLFGNGGANTLFSNSAVTITARYSLLDASVTGYTDGGNNLTTNTSPFVSTTTTQLNGNAPAINAGLNSAPGLGGITTDLAGNPRFFNTVDMGAYEYQAVPPVNSPIRYVKEGGAGTGSGDSWVNASGDLQNQVEARGAQQVWVAQGTYKPGPAGNTDRSISFAMKDGVAIYGGFSATDSPTSLTARNPGSFTTVLSGDINTVGNPADNSYHVISNPNRLTSTAVLDGFIITGGAAAVTQSGINGINGAIDTRLSNGGGMLNGKFNPDGSAPSGSEASSPTLRNCLFLSNFALQLGGGMANLGGNPTLISCSFQNNSAQSSFGVGGLGSGGGLGNAGGNPTLTNCSFQNNSAQFGGGLGNAGGNPTLTNCSFQSNSSVQLGGGGIVNNNGNVSLTNCVLFGNGFSALQAGGGTIMVRYSLLQLIPGPQSSYTDGGNNLTTVTSPFVSTTDTRLSPRSPAIDAGLNSAPGLAGITTDLAGNPRFFNGTVDMGAYEYRADLLPIRYVKEGGAGTGSGDSWANASSDLQAMIDASSQQVWVATGTYKPGPANNTDRSSSFAMKNGIAIYGGFAATGNPANLSERNPSSFTTVLSGDIGTAGNPADNSYHVISNPNRLTSTAVLDGFIITGGNTNGSNIFQSFGGGMSNGVLNPDGSAPSGSEASSPTLRNCLFLSNFAQQFGGGMANLGGNPTLINCSFQNNSAQFGGGLGSGGGLGNAGGNPTLINCSFQNNSASTGGGMANAGGNPTLINCSFQNNSASMGSGIANGNGNVSLTNCVLFGNDGANTLLSTGAVAITARYSLFDASVTGYTDGGNNLTTVTSPFVSATDTRLNGCSPAINAGDNGANSTAIDLAGNPRFFNNSTGTPDRIDMGAYEYQGTAGVVTSAPGVSTATVGVAFSQNFTASGGTSPYSYTLASGSLPSGLSLSNTGVLSGTPTQTGSFTLTVRGQDATGCSGVSTPYGLTVIDATPTITGLSANPAAVCMGSPVTFTATLGNLTGSYSYTLSNGSSTQTGNSTTTTFTQPVVTSGSGNQTYTLTVRANDQSATATTSVAVNDLPLASLQASGPVTCASPSVTLTAGGGE